jgi:hypothetical protein
MVDIDVNVSQKNKKIIKKLNKILIRLYTYKCSFLKILHIRYSHKKNYAYCK